MHADEGNLNDISQRVIGGAFTVLNVLGARFLEKVYENALAHELRKAGLAVEQQRGLTITYDGIVAGEYVADLIVERALLIELKTVTALNVAHHAQCINYLKAFGLKLGLLLNFGMKRLEVKRVANTV
jgi:GxxExxY protein